MIEQKPRFSKPAAFFWLLATRPSPRLAYVLTIVFMMGRGSVICLAMVLGGI